MSCSSAFLFLFYSLFSFVFSHIPNTNNNGGVIFVSPPLQNDPYYRKHYKDLMDFYAGLIHQVERNKFESIFALVDAPGNRELLSRNVSADCIMELAPSYKPIDVWIRDFGCVQVGEQVFKFKYRPDYLRLITSIQVDNSMLSFLDYQGIHYKMLDLILDGGNFVLERATKRVIITERILFDNPQYGDKQSMKNALKAMMGLKAVAIIPEEPEDTLGHADGAVAFLSENIVAVNNYFVYNKTEWTALYHKIVKELVTSFPGIQIVTMPWNPRTTIYDIFPSARGVYVNILSTLKSLYVPDYALPSTDGKAFEMVQKYKNVKVAANTVNCTKVSVMGGAVNCLTFYLTGNEAEKFKKKFKQRKLENFKK